VRVLVAGERGYIGAVLVPFLRAAGHQVDGLDVGLYEGCDLGPALEESGQQRFRDMRDVVPGELAGYDAVLCLAALSNDPVGDLNPDATYSVNLDGTLNLAKAAKEAGVARFLFSSSCSLYGAAGSAGVAEDAEMFPVTPYGQSKVDAERDLSLLADDNFSPVYLRNATAYGASTRLRLDIVVNNLTAVALTTGTYSAMARRGGRWCTSRTSAAPSWPRSRHRASLSTTRRSTSAATRTTSRSAMSPRWSARPCPGRI
jgi:nucleoside-diphosphate-sugar epimerase